MRTLRMPISMLAALAVTAVAVGVYAQPAEPPTDTPPEAAPAEGADTAPAEGAETPAEGSEGAETPPPPKPTSESNCTDGVDEDGDGVTDCADSDCASNAACAPPPPPAAEPPPPAAEPVAPPPPAEPEADMKTDEPPPPETTFGIEGLAGVSGRIGSVSSGYDSTERAGLQYGLGAIYAPNRQFGFGLSYVYSRLGKEEFDPSVSDATGRVERHLHNVAALLRAYPLRSDTIGLWAGLNVGLTWQTASANGTLATTTMTSPAMGYQVDAGPQAGLALGASLGMDLDLSNDVGMLTSVNFTNHRLTSDALDGDEGGPAIPGVGSVSQIDFRLAFQYRFDVSGKQSPVSASVNTASK